MVDGVDRFDVINVFGILIYSNLSFRAQVDRPGWGKCSDALRPQDTETSWIEWASALECCNCYTDIPPHVCFSCVDGVWWTLVESRLQSVLNKAEKTGFFLKNQASLELLCDSADMKLSSSVLQNHYHVLH